MLPIPYTQYQSLREEFCHFYALWKHKFINGTISDVINKYVLADSSRRLRVLEVGASTRPLFESLSQEKILLYNTIDSDESCSPDYTDFLQISEDSYDLVIAHNVVEHMCVDYFYSEFLPQVSRISCKNAHLVISIPNIYYNLGIRTDVDHVQAYGPRELYALVKSGLGFSSFMDFRVGSVNVLLRPILSLMTRTILRPYQLDFASSTVFIFNR